MDHFDDIGPSVVMASPGMMQSGLSRELFESWCTDKRNGVIIAGYCVEGTLAKVRQSSGGGKVKFRLVCGNNALAFALCSTSCQSRRKSRPCLARSCS